MRAFLVASSALLISACGLMPPKVESLEQGLMAPAKICGDSSDLVAILFYDIIVVNVMAVDDQLTPTFREEKRNLIGLQTIPDLSAYCVSVSGGEHEITLLAERGRGIGTTGSTDYYVGSCVLRFAKGGEYTVAPKRSGDWYEEVVVHVIADGRGDPLGVCELTQIPRDALFDLLEDMRP
jgi:hypothetical protein